MPSKLKDLMSDYLTDDLPAASPVPFYNLLKESMSPSEFPVCPVQTNTWEVVTDPNRLMRTFEFQTFEEMSMFLAEVLKYQEELQHHGKITIDHRKVIVEVYTHDVNDVTEIDKEYAGVVDNILKDVEYAMQASDDDGGYSAGY